MPIFSPTSFRHEQLAPATVWSIVHNLGGNGSQGLPVVDTFVSDGVNLVKINPVRVEKIDANTVEIEFSTARSGFAVVIV